MAYRNENRAVVSLNFPVPGTPYPVPVQLFLLVISMHIVTRFLVVQAVIVRKELAEYLFLLALVNIHIGKLLWRQQQPGK